MPIDVPITGTRELDQFFEQVARYVLSLERQIATLQWTGGVAGCYIGRVVDADVTAAVDDDNPGFGMMEIMQVYPNVNIGEFALRGPGPVVPIMNLAKGLTAPIPVGKQIATMPIINKPGHQLVILDPCNE